MQVNVLILCSSFLSPPSLSVSPDASGIIFSSITSSLLIPPSLQLVCQLLNLPTELLISTIAFFTGSSHVCFGEDPAWSLFTFWSLWSLERVVGLGLSCILSPLFTFHLFFALLLIVSCFCVRFVILS